jgi:hypothetical protein
VLRKAKPLVGVSSRGSGGTGREGGGHRPKVLKERVLVREGQFAVEAREQRLRETHIRLAAEPRLVRLRPLGRVGQYLRYKRLDRSDRVARHQIESISGGMRVTRNVESTAITAKPGREHNVSAP